MKLSNSVKIMLVLLFFAVSIAGFMIRLPSVFRHHDKHMHTLFYFVTAAFLNMLFTKRNIIRHAVVFILLYLFGMAIEYAQEYSNKLLHRRIHGRYDVEDVAANLKGLIAFSIIWLVYTAVVFVYKSLRPAKADINLE